MPHFCKREFLYFAGIEAVDIIFGYGSKICFLCDGFGGDDVCLLYQSSEAGPCYAATW